MNEQKLEDLYEEKVCIMCNRTIYTKLNPPLCIKCNNFYASYIKQYGPIDVYELGEKYKSGKCKVKHRHYKPMKIKNE